MKIKRRAKILQLLILGLLVSLLLLIFAFRSQIIKRPEIITEDKLQHMRQLPYGYPPKEDAVVDLERESELRDMVNSVSTNSSIKVYFGKTINEEYLTSTKKAATNKEFIASMYAKYFIDENPTTLILAKYLSTPVNKALPGFIEPVELHAETIPIDQVEEYMNSEICYDNEFVLDRFSVEGLLNGLPLIQPNVNSAWEDRANLLVLFPRNNCTSAEVFVNHYFEPSSVLGVESFDLLSQDVVFDNIAAKKWRYYALYNLSDPNLEEGLPNLPIKEYTIKELSLAYFIIEDSLAIPFWRLCGSAHLSSPSTDAHMFCAATYAIDNESIPNDAKFEAL